MSYSAEVLADSPRAYYRLGEASGTTLVDSSGNGRDGIYANSPTLAATGLLTGDADTAVNFDGTNDYAKVVYGSWLDTSTAVTVEAIIRPESLTGQRAIVDRDPFGERVFQFRTNGNKLEFIKIGGTGGVVTGASVSSLAINTTYHVAVTYDGSNIRLYINGVLDKTTAAAGNLGTANSDMLIGASWGGSSSDSAAPSVAFFDGTIDEVAYYGTVLSDARISAHYAAASGVPGSTVNGGLVSESTSVLAGVSSGAVVVSGGVVSEATTVLAGSMADSGSVVGGLIAETTTVLAGSASFGYSITARNTTSGRRRGGVASAEWEPNVAPIPAGMSRAVVFDTALAFDTPTIVNGRPLVQVDTATAPRDRHRIVVNGVDVTFFRGVPTPELDYQLTEPLLYGPGTLDLPQVFAAFEQPGTGDLSWLKPGARVKQQRVNADGVVTATDYKGRIIAFDTAGAEFRAEIGGEASGMAALRERQVPLYRQVKDLGRQIYNALTPLGVRVKPFLGTVTGIETVVTGGTGWLDHLHRLHASGQKRNGDLLTTMPNANGVYVTGWKDRTTIHATAYPHDVQMPATLRRDIAEEPNRVYGTGVTPDGMRVLGGVYPGMIQGDAPDYPMADDSNFGEGTVNADTDMGDGISVMIAQLRVHGYVSRDDSPGGYDNDVTKAVRDLQDEAGLTVTGNMNPATWRALFNLNRTGYSMSWSRIEPMAQKPGTKKWRRTADGSVIGRNPNYNPNKLVVDHNVDFGNGFTKGQMRDFAKGEVDQSEDNWVGDLTITTGALIRGNHTPGTPITAADVMPAADIKPGMNISLPLFMGGIVVHVSGTRSAEGGSRSLHLDTRARDSVPVSQVILRNRETRKDPHRAFVRDHLSSGLVRDAVTEFSEVGGILGGDVALKAGEWRVFDVPSGRAGIIERLKLITDAPAEFTVAVFGERISAKKLQARIGDPLSAPGKANWTDQAILNELDRDHLLLYVAGDNDAPCGYWPKTKDGTTHPITGKWQDDAGFGYSVGRANVLRVAVCADRATTIPAGRIMWPQLEPM